MKNPNVCLFELGPGPTYGIAYIPKMVSPSSVLHTPLLTNNPSSPKSINTCSNESAGMSHVWSFVLSLKWNLSFLAGLGMTSFLGQFCTPYLPSNVSHSTTSWQSRKKSGEKAINFDDRKSFSITITGSRGQLVPSLSGLFVHFQLKACQPCLLACHCSPFYIDQQVSG